MPDTVPIDQLADAIDEKLDEQGELPTEETEPTAQEVPAQEPAEETAEEPKPTTTVGDLKNDHYERIVEKNLQVRDAGVAFSNAKQKASEAKKRFDRLTADLSDLVAQDPLQHRLPFGDTNDPETEVSAPNVDQWRAKPVYELDIPVGLAEKLVDAGLGKLGELQDYWAAGKQLYDITGIGNEKAAVVADAFSDYGAKHPELFGEEETEEDPLETAEAEPEAEEVEELAEELAEVLPEEAEAEPLQEAETT